MKLSLVVSAALLLAPLVACGPSAEEDAGVESDTSALATECSSVLPTWIGGRVYGEDGRAINALIGISFTTAEGGHLDKNGTLPCDDDACTTYSVVQHVNPTLPATGGPAAGNVSTWGKCVGTPASKVWIEVYPRGADGKTSFARYGAAVDNRLIKRGTSNVFDLRLPVRAELGGNAGAIAGAVTCHGKPVEPTVIRAWSNDAGSECGIQGFAASGETAAGSYELSNLAAGQCNAPSQLYQARVTAACDGAVTTQTKFGNVSRGQTTRIDFAF
ncbi:MAG: hypothetical protein JWP97_5953 [Labilithrix sp.]|nr:hypothetical protein [Labilithrix sp.]